MTEFLALTITAMVPFLFVAQGTMLSGRAGIFNVAQEGLMLLGAAVGYLVSLKAGGNVVGLIAAALAGAVVGFVLSWATTSLRLDQFVVGLALFFLAGLILVGIARREHHDPIEPVMTHEGVERYEHRREEGDA